jgi:hypothetical protein
MVVRELARKCFDLPGQVAFLRFILSQLTSKAANRSCQTFNVSTTIEVSSDLHASMNDLVRVIESEDSPLGDD